MTDATSRLRRGFRLLFVVSLIVLPACQNGGDSEAPEPALQEGAEGVGSVQLPDTTRLQMTYDEIDEHYGQMMASYEGMSGQMSPEAQRLYDQMQQHYHEGMPHGSMGSGMMGRHMMQMQDREEWSQQMLDLHQRMAQVHAGEGHDEMAAMHEEMTRLYRDALADRPASAEEQMP